jgi:hypothetical protein
MTRRRAAAFAAVALALIGCSPAGQPAASARATATATAGTSATVTSIPTELTYVWLGPARTIEGLGGPLALSIMRIRGSELDYIYTEAGSETLSSVLSIAAPGRVTFTSATEDGCRRGDEGTYAWATTPGGANLTMTTIGDACTTRAEAVAGEWVRAACKDFGCLGKLEAGLHRTAFFEPLGQPAGSTAWRMQYGQLSYTVPSGWANANDAAGLYNLVLQSDYARDVSDENAYPGIYLLVDPGVASTDQACTTEVEPGGGLDGDAVVAAMADLPDLEVGQATPIVVAGRDGTARDIGYNAGSAEHCAESGGLPVLTDRRIRPGEHWRLILADLAGGHTLAIVIDDAAEPGRFDELVSQAMPIVDSLEVDAATR